MSALGDKGQHCQTTEQLPFWVKSCVNAQRLEVRIAPNSGHRDSGPSRRQGLTTRLDPRYESDIGWLFQLIVALCRAAWRGWSAAHSWAFWIEIDLFLYESGPPVRKKVGSRDFSTPTPQAVLTALSCRQTKSLGKKGGRPLDQPVGRNDAYAVGDGD